MTKNLDSYKDTHITDIGERQSLYPFIASIFDANVFQIMVDSSNHIQPISGLHSLYNDNSKLNNQFIYYLHQVKSTVTAEKMILVGVCIKHLPKKNYSGKL